MTGVMAGGMVAVQLHKAGTQLPAAIDRTAEGLAGLVARNFEVSYFTRRSRRRNELVFYGLKSGAQVWAARPHTAHCTLHTVYRLYTAYTTTPLHHYTLYTAHCTPITPWESFLRRPTHRLRTTPVCSVSLTCSGLRLSVCVGQLAAYAFSIAFTRVHLMTKDYHPPEGEFVRVHP